MRAGPLAALWSVNAELNAFIHRRSWVTWLFVYVAELSFFSAYRLSNLGELVESSVTPEDDTTGVRISGFLLGVLQDFVVASMLLVLLCSFDAAINQSACCNDTAPNGCLDCFTRGIPFRALMKLIFKRVVRLVIFFLLFVLSVTIFALDIVTVRTHRQRYSLDGDADNQAAVVPSEEEDRIYQDVMIIVFAVQGFFAVATAVWLDLTRWTPLRFTQRWMCRPRRSYELSSVTVTGSQQSTNYLGVPRTTTLFDSNSSDHPSPFFDSEDRPIRGTQPPPQPTALLSDDLIDLPTPRWKFVAFGAILAGIVFILVPLLVLLITSYCPPAVASIGLNANLSECIRVITTLSFATTSPD